MSLLAWFIDLVLRSISGGGRGVCDVLPEIIERDYAGEFEEDDEAVRSADHHERLQGDDRKI